MNSQMQRPPLPHPRRPTANHSVSLLHPARVNLARLDRKARHVSDDRNSSSSEGRTTDQSRSVDANQRSAPSSMVPLGRDSSGESSNAERWFEKSNNEVRDDAAAFADNDSPFYMRNSSSSETPPDGQLRDHLETQGEASLPLRTNLLQINTDGSSTDDFRGVIDDLTIQNKKLKRRLKKYEKLHDSHLKDQKLFEVRVHGLPPDKKLELEETLRKFAMTLRCNEFPLNGYDGLLPLLNTHKTASSQASLHNTDSAYASMSVSAQESAQSGNDSRYKQISRPNAASRHQNIHSYLHHIPEGLMPQPNHLTMSESAKKKAVVRRLEQLFAGKGAVGGHQHPQQQQEVSQLAARAERSAGAAGQLHGQEGLREAAIMGDEMEGPTDKSRNDGESPENDSNNSNGRKKVLFAVQSITGAADGAQTTNVEQRPTRPLDLDPHRAQVPADNLRYMRHLGFSPLEVDQTPAEGHAWIYLNFLINMAQLHTINVTAEFVKKALSEYGDKFEISEDGRKVRWKGRSAPGQGSSTGGGSSNSRLGVNTPDRAEKSPRKRPRLSGRMSSARTENSRVAYTPLFYHADSTDETDDSSEDEEDDMSSLYPPPVAGDSSGMTSSGVVRPAGKKQKKLDDGPIIFYNNAYFCADLSGDSRATGNNNAPPYITASKDAVGKPIGKSNSPLSEKRGPLADVRDLPEPMDLSDNPIPESLELTFPRSSPLRASSALKVTPVEMEVTGFGGVWPADNFAIAVESRLALIGDAASDAASLSSSETAAPSKPAVRLPLAQILSQQHEHQGTTRRGKRSGGATVRKEIVRMTHQALQPSNLPPPLNFIPSRLGGDYDDDEDDDTSMSDDDDLSLPPVDACTYPPSTAPQPVQLPYASSSDLGADSSAYDEDDDDDDDGDDDEADDGELDLLATAREVDPEAIREQEREYDANMAERLAEEIPAGSSAATAGGGSGYASPSARLPGGSKEYERAVQESRNRQQQQQQQCDRDRGNSNQPSTTITKGGKLVHRSASAVAAANASTGNTSASKRNSSAKQGTLGIEVDDFAFNRDEDDDLRSIDDAEPPGEGRFYDDSSDESEDGSADDDDDDGEDDGEMNDVAS